MRSVGPVEFVRLYRKFPWLRQAAKINKLMDFASNSQDCMNKAIQLLAIYQTGILNAHVKNPDRLIWYEELLTPEIPLAMGFSTFMTESLGLVFPLLDRNGAIPYVDRTENEGFPADMCSFIKTPLGQVLSGELPKPRLILTTNSPCDSAMAGYLPIEREMGVPVFRMDHPFETNERSLGISP